MPLSWVFEMNEFWNLCERGLDFVFGDRGRSVKGSRIICETRKPADKTNGNREAFQS
jgi:hypothetical protein